MKPILKLARPIKIGVTRTSSITSRKAAVMHAVLLSALLCSVGPVFGQNICNTNVEKAHIMIGGADYIVQNNRWGSDQPECITLTSTGFTVSQSDITINTNKFKNAPGGYPSIYQGCHFKGSFATNPTDCTDPNSSKLPLQITGIAAAVSSWTTDQSQVAAADVYNVSYDLWFNSQQQIPAGAEPDRTELMVWLNKQGMINNGPVTPVGNPATSGTPVLLDNATWDVWLAPPDPSVNRPWNVVSYVLKTPTASITHSGVTQLDLLAFINDATSRSCTDGSGTVQPCLDSSSFLTSAEAGFEIWQGGAHLTTNSFSFQATPGTNPGLNCTGLTSAPLNIWWPNDGSTQFGTQPFKARLENIPLSCYQMFWSVDGGQLNPMAGNSTGGDHKEASVDLSGWTWRDAGTSFGPFSVSFIVQDTPGHTVQSRTITIYVAKPTLSIWWPTDGSVVSGTQPFKARLENVALSAYQMYWSVDGGQLNLMGDNVDHKETQVDLSGWTWRDAGANYGPFAVTFTGKNSSGAILQQKTINIYRAK